MPATTAIKRLWKACLWIYSRLEANTELMRLLAVKLLHVDSNRKVLCSWCRRNQHAGWKRTMLDEEILGMYALGC